MVEDREGYYIMILEISTGTPGGGGAGAYVEISMNPFIDTPYNVTIVTGGAGYGWSTDPGNHGHSSPGN